MVPDFGKIFLVAAQKRFSLNAQTNAYLGASSSDNHVYYVGPASGGSLDVGALSGLMAAANCK